MVRRVRPVPKPKPKSRHRPAPKPRPKPKPKPKPRPRPVPKLRRPPRSPPRTPAPRRLIRPAIVRAPVLPRERPSTQPWVLDISDPSLRRQKVHQLREDVQALREVFTGFDATDGYDVRHPESWSAARVKRVQRYGIRLRALKASPHIIVRPRSEAQRIALLRHVAQPWPNMKAFVVHTPHPKGTSVRYVLEPARLLPFHATKPAQLRVQLVRPIHGGRQYTRDFLFREILGYQPGLSGPGGRFRRGRNPWDDMVYATRMLLPYLPDTAMSARTRLPEEAWYTLISMPHDSIGGAIRKSELVNTLLQDYAHYSESFAGLILGFRYQGSRWKAAMSPKSEMHKRERWRQIYKKERQETLRDMRRMDVQLVRKPKPKPKPKPKKTRSKTARRKK